MHRLIRSTINWWRLNVILKLNARRAMFRRYCLRCAHGAIMSIGLVYLAFILVQTVLTSISFDEHLKINSSSKDELRPVRTNATILAAEAHATTAAAALRVTTARPHSPLNDIFISVKTSEKFHTSRLDVIIYTWFTLARDQVSYF